jgi:hypothetical protein
LTSKNFLELDLQGLLPDVLLYLYIVFVVRGGTEDITWNPCSPLIVSLLPHV